MRLNDLLNNGGEVVSLGAQFDQLSCELGSICRAVSVLTTVTVCWLSASKISPAHTFYLRGACL